MSLDLSELCDNLIARVVRAEARLAEVEAERAYWEREFQDLHAYLEKFYDY